MNQQPRAGDSSEAQSERQIYLAAVKISESGERKAFLGQACHGRPELHARIEQLIAAGHAGQPNPLERVVGPSDPPPDDETSHTMTESTPHTASGTAASTIDISQHPMIGRYKLLEEVGQGGMGTVYMAQQTQPVQRKVAFKIINPGMNSREVLARFEAERQALALMDHPNIASVFDGGTTDSGLPYFVMELVRGVPLTEFCREKKLTLKERLQLFVDVCSAVQHAHQKGIIHRDLKPSNIMVTLHDDRPVVKVIDFGVAKALNQNLTEKTLFTKYSSMIGTPLYMSPEQAQLSGLDVDTRSDIYSLGVILYELLTGTTPFDKDTLSSVGIDEFRKLISTAEPPRPSTRASELKSSGRAFTDDPRQFQMISISSELDWIVMKALEKDRERRYETANAFAADVRRYLSDEPVEACPPSVAYRLGKYSRRHKGILVSAAAIFFALLVGTGLATWQAVLASEAAEQAEHERAEAERNMRAAMDAVERLLANVNNPKLANAPGLQESWASILKETIDFYERFKAESGGSPEVDQRAARVYLHFGSLLQSTSPTSKEVIRKFRRGLELAEKLVLEQPKRADFRELLADLRLGCAEYGIAPRNTADESADELTWNHLQQARDQFAYLALAEPGNHEYSEKQGFVYSKMADFVFVRSQQSPRIEPLIQQASDLGYEMSHADQARLLSKRAPKRATQHWRKAIAEYRSDPTKIDSDEISRMFIGHVEKIVDTSLDDDQFFEDVLWVLGKGIEARYETLQDFPTNWECYNALHDLSWKYSQLLMKAERPAGAMEKLDAMVKETPAMHGARANFLKEGIDYDDRLAALNQAISEYPNYAVYYRKRALCYKWRGRPDDAIADFSTAIQINKNDSWSFYHRAQLYFELEQYDHAASDYSVRLATMRSWRTPYVLKRRAAAYFRLGEYDQAMADLQQAAAKLPRDSSVITWISPSEVAACPDAEFRAAMLQLADRMVELNDGSAAFRARRARLLIEVGETQGAMEDLQAGLGDVVNADAYYSVYKICLLALQHEDQDRYRQLCQELVAAVDIDAEKSPMYFAVWTAALAPVALEDYEKAIALAAKCVEQAPENPRYLTGLGAIQMRAGLYEETLATLRKSMQRETTSKTSEAYRTYFRALTLQRLGRSDDFREALAEANELADKELTDKANPPSWKRKLTLELLREEAR